MELGYGYAFMAAAQTVCDVLADILQDEGATNDSMAEITPIS